MKNVTTSYDAYSDVCLGIVDLVEKARRSAIRSVNAFMTATYWEVGRRIVEFEQLGAERAAYGEELIKRLSGELSLRFGRGFSPRNIAQMKGFYLAWPCSNILQTVSAKFDFTEFSKSFPLPWSAYVRLLAVKKESARQFYEAETMRCGWSVRQLDRQINSQFYERAALSKNKDAMLEKGAVALPEDVMKLEEVIRDPFVLEFLSLKDEYSESDLEEALIRNLSDFFMELGDDFAFIGRQRRLRIDDAWFRVDLLFFHRRLKCMVLIDLKIGKFTHADAGQMQLYLNYAKEHWVKPGENAPVGLILCALKGRGEAHYALEGLQNKVIAAEYQTILPNEQQLVDALKRTQEGLETQKLMTLIREDHE